jgi:hypothetical protein
MISWRCAPAALFDTQGFHRQVHGHEVLDGSLTTLNSVPLVICVSTLLVAA